MRVTKIIREYVEKSVKERLPKPEKPADTLQEEYNAFVKSLETCCRNAMKEFVRNHGGEFCFSYSGYDADMVEAQIAYVDKKCNLVYPALKTIAMDEYYNLCKEIEKKRDAVIEDILVSLELGGTRTDLEEMLSKIG